MKRKYRVILTRRETEDSDPPTPHRCLPWCSRERASVAFKGIWTKSFRRAVSGEFLATLICVLLGLGSTVDWASGTEKPSPADLVLVSLCFSLGVATVVQCFLPFSSCHINPVGKLSLAKALFYVTAQCLGAIAAAGLLYLLTPSAVRGNLGVTNVTRPVRCLHVNLDISVGHALLVELLITFELLFTVTATCNAKRADLTGSASLAIGLAVVIGHLFAVNPVPKSRCRERFSRDASGKYKEVEGSSLQQAGEADDISVRPGSWRSIEERRRSLSRSCRLMCFLRYDHSVDCRWRPGCRALAVALEHCGPGWS
uniref:Aquaporin 4 n=1 Tax=Electrophorus electricus TaxID=8005 RepID=A0A4W4EHI1_ELEEL